MADSKNHIINRINADIHCRQRDLDRVQQSGLASRLAQSLEKLSPFLNSRFGERTVKLEALAIELTVKNDQLSNLDQLVANALVEALETIEESDKLVSSPKFEAAPDLSPGDVFLYFLRRGQMPWFSSKLDYEKIDFSDPFVQKKLASTLKESHLARERLVHQFTVQELKGILSAIYPAEFVKPLFRFLPIFLENTKQYSGRFGAGHRLGQQLLVSALHFLQEGAEPAFATYLFRYWDTLVGQIRAEANGEHLAFLKLIRMELATRFKIEIADREDQGDRPDAEKDKMGPTVENDPLKHRESVEDIWEEGKKEKQQMVFNAGTVLLHPFLTRFFNKVGLLENNRFISAAHQQRGICLLHNLATGEMIFPEEELLFFKYLCNYPSHHPVPRELPISDFELEEVTQVLRSAIAHWTALKRTGIDGLRVNFLQRKGLLEEDGMGHTLHVEGHTADILIDGLPWGLSTIHLPWLPNILTIKWR